MKRLFPVENHQSPRYLKIMILIRLSCLAIITAAATTLAAHSAAAQTPRSLGTFQQWDAFVLGAGNDRVCYMATIPRSSQPGSVNHGTVYVTVSHKLARKVRDEVNIVTGYNFRPDSTVSVRIGGTSVTMFTSGKEAWAYDPAGDAKLVAAMKRGATMNVTGRSQRGTRTSYTFSLMGFTAAHEAVTKACGLG